MKQAQRSNFSFFLRLLQDLFVRTKYEANADNAWRAVFDQPIKYLVAGFWGVLPAGADKTEEREANDSYVLVSRNLLMRSPFSLLRCSLKSDYIKHVKRQCCVSVKSFEIH